MSSRKLLQQMFGLTLVMLLLAGCGGSPAGPTATSASALATVTPTSVLPTDTSTPLPPTPTLTPVPPTPTPVGGGSGQIAFVSNRDGNREIYLMNVDGSGQTNLTKHGADDEWPTMSPDGTRIAFISWRDEPNPRVCSRDGSCNTEIYLTNADGTGLTRLTDIPGMESFPVWSPDGTQIAFISWRNGKQDVYVMNADGSNQTNLTNDPGVDLYPAWMPDGTQIVFLSTRDNAFQFYVVNIDGSGLTMLDSGLPPSEFTPSQTVYFATTFEDGELGYYLFAVGGGGAQSMNDDGLALGEFPAWSPDGTRIAFHSDRDGNMDVYVMSADRPELARLTDSDAIDMFPAWSPDGTKIVFHSFRDGNVEIYVMNADGTGLTRLTDNGAEDLCPAWWP